MRKRWLLAALVPTLAHADVLKATRDQPMFEVSHTVDVRIEDGVAVYKVKRQFANPGKVADEAGLMIDLPAGGAATGLRIRAKERWYDGELMERGKAAALYQEMTGFGAYAPKDPALLQWLWADKLYLQVFPVMPGEVSTVEYTITVPTRYAGGRYWMSYPRLAATDPKDTSHGLPLATPIVTVHPAWGNALTQIVVDGKRVAPDTAIVLSPPFHEAWETAVGADPSGSYVASAIEVPASSHTQQTFSTAKVTVDIRHTYKGDLRVELLAPSGEHVTLFDRTGGGDNNIAATFPVKFVKPTVGAGTWRLVVSDHAGLDNGSIDKWSLVVGDTTLAATDTPVFIPDAPETANDAGLATLSVAAQPIATWTARLGKVTASPQHAFGRLEVDVAKELVPLPRRAQIVFAIDTSFSATDAMVEAQLAVMRTYLSHVPDAEVELVTYQREARRVFGKFIPASAIGPAIADARAAGKLALGNGSAIDAAARLATTLLADRKGPRRLVVATDHLLRTSLSDAAALASLARLPADVVVHVVAPQLDHDDRVSLVRDDKDPLSPLATRHHGIYVALSGMPAKTDKDLMPIVLELVRPTRIEKLALSGGFTAEDVLHEGEGLRLLIKDTDAKIPGRVVLQGVMWSDPIRKELVVNDAFSRSAAAWVFGEDEYHDLSVAEQLKVAFMGRAVSPVTSYVAAEPGTRPSSIGFPLNGSGTGAGYGTSNGRGMMGSGYRAPPDLGALIDRKACIAKFAPAAGWRVQLEVETTKDEVVDVSTDDRSAFATCVLEATWRVRLTPAFDLQREQFSVELRD